MLKLKRSIFIPILLLLYLLFMAIYFGYPSYQQGDISIVEFTGIVVTTLIVILLLHFSLKKRERLRREREEDMRNP